MDIKSQNSITQPLLVSANEKSIVKIASLTAKGDLPNLKVELNNGLDSGLTINQTKEILVHLYAYCGFPRSIIGLQTFMEVVNERKSKGINDVQGEDAKPINTQGNKYERGKDILAQLTQTPQTIPKTGYGAFAPTIDVFLKEHLFADIFERDILTFAERELITISVLSTIANAEPMLRSHFAICLNVGHAGDKLSQIVEIIQPILGEETAKNTKQVLNELLNRTK